MCKRTRRERLRTVMAAALTGSMLMLAGCPRPPVIVDPPPPKPPGAITLKAPVIGGLADAEAHYTWIQTRGLEVDLDTADPRNPTFVPPGDLAEETEFAFTVEIEAQGRASRYEVSAIVPPTAQCLGNRPPVAVASEDFMIARVGETVVLNAGNSNDPDIGEQLSYRWTQVDLADGGLFNEGGPVDLIPIPPAGATFQATRKGNLLFTVFVSDECYTVSHTMAVAVLGEGLCSTVSCMPGFECNERTGECDSLLDPCHEVNCDDGDPCTDDVCFEGSCMHEAVPCPGGDGEYVSDAECADGIFCNGIERCEKGLCVDGIPSCSSDLICDEAIDRCAECRADEDCLSGQRCADGRCIDDDLCAGVDCDDGDPCTNDSCDPGTGACVNDPVICDGGGTCIDGVCLPDPPSDNIVSTFANDDEGWRVFGNDVTVPNWSPTEGRPLGHVWIQDQGRDVWYWDAPAKFLGDVSSAYDRSLKFDISQSRRSQQFDDADIILQGAGTTLVFETTYNPHGGWTHYSIRLLGSAGWRNSVTGERATEAEMIAVLSDLGQLLIRGEFRQGDDSGGLDNVLLEMSDPEPPLVENVASRFDNQDHGWTVIGNGSIGASRPAWEVLGGRPGGFASIADAANWTWYWDAPAQFRGNMSNAYGRTLTFDISQERESQQFDDADVVLRGDGLTLVFDSPYNPHGGLTHYSVRMDESAGWRDQFTGEPATQDQIGRVLSSLGQLMIRGEFREGADQGGIDNVVLDLGSEPVVPVIEDVLSDFENQDHGWTVVGNGSIGVSRPEWQVSGGRPGGFASIADGANWTWYWDAPAEFLGDVSGAYGRKLNFDISQERESQQFDDADVVLRGDGLTLVYDTFYNPHGGWTSYSIRLDETAGWRDLLTNEPATRDQMLRVLGALGQLMVRGEFRNGSDSGGIDHVVLELTDPPAPKSRTVVSDFEDDQHGWTVIGNGSLGASRPDWSPINGRPGGFASIRDQSSWTWYWDAPSEFLGDVSAAFDRRLDFDLIQSRTSQPFDAADVILRGAGLVLTFDTATDPGTGWTAYSIGLDERAGWRNARTGEPATVEELFSVLSELKQILIRGEFRQGDDTGGIDNVALELD